MLAAWPFFTQDGGIRSVDGDSVYYNGKREKTYRSVGVNATTRDQP